MRGYGPQYWQRIDGFGTIIISALMQPLNTHSVNHQRMKTATTHRWVSMTPFSFKVQIMYCHVKHNQQWFLHDCKSKTLRISYIHNVRDRQFQSSQTNHGLVRSPDCNWWTNWPSFRMQSTFGKYTALSYPEVPDTTTA